MENKLFLIIGAMKAGTSTLHGNLKTHPQILMSKDKEPNYFAKKFYKPHKWYKNKFPTTKGLIGDATPAYSWRHIYPDCARNINSLYPEAKIIFIVRDPIERIISHLHHDLYRGRLKSNEANRFVLSHPHYIKTSSYYYQIEPYLERWERKNILFLDFNDLREDLEHTLNEVCDFLDIYHFRSNQDTIVTNQSSKKYLIKGHDIVSTYLPSAISKLYRTFWYLLNIKINRPELDQRTLIALKKKLASDVDKFKDLVGSDFSHWNLYNEIPYKP